MVMPDAGDEGRDILAAISASTNVNAAATRLQELLHGSAKGGTGLESAKENTKPSFSKDCVSTTTRVRGRAASKQPLLPTKGPARAAKELPSQLDERERYSLATSAFNASLAALSALLKRSVRRTSCQLQPRSSELATDVTNISSTDVTSKAQPPRADRRSTNKGAACDSPLRTSEDIEDIRASEARAIAKCANTSLRYLGARRGKVSHAQLVNGTSALISKCLALKLPDQSAEALRYQRFKLGQQDGADATRSAEQKLGRKEGSSAAKARPKTTTASLLDVNAAKLDEDAIAPIVAYQLQVLKLLVLEKKSQSIEDASPFLQCDNPESPVALAIKLATQTNDIKKAARYLEDVSRTLFALCPSVSTAADSTALNNDQSPNPLAVFQLQGIAFRARLHWWALASHRADAVMDLWDPLAKCVNAFARRATISPSGIYQEVLDQVEALNAATATLLPKLPVDEFGANLPRALSACAKRAGRSQEASRWVRQLQKRLNHQDGAGIKKAIDSVELASLHLANGSDEASDQVKRAAAALAERFTASAADEDALLGELMSLRKVALRWIVEHTEGRRHAEDSERKIDAVFPICCDAIMLCSSHLRRYASARGEAYEPANPRKQDGASLGARALSTTLDALTACARGINNVAPMAWVDLDTGLGNCIAAMDALNIPKNDSASDQYRLACSRTYWAWYLQQKKSGQLVRTKQERLLCLQKCVDVLRDESPQGKSMALFDVKTERLSAELASVGDLDKAEDTLLEAVRWLIEVGALKELETAANTKSCVGAWSEKSGQALCRILKKLDQVLKKQGKHGFDLFEKSGFEWSKGQKAVLLEWCLWTSNFAVGGGFNYLSTAVLEAYSARDYPLRRIRAAAVVLLISGQEGHYLSEDVSNAAKHSQPPVTTNLRHDVDLQRFSAHYAACHDLARAFTSSPPSLGLIKSALEAWAAEPAPDVDQTDGWLRYLRLASDYLEISGDHLLRISALKVHIRACERFTSTEGNYAELVDAKCDLARQYIRVGSLHLAETGLQQAKVLFDGPTADANCEAAARLNLTDALYQHAIGNYDACTQALSLAQTVAELLLTTGSAPKGTEASPNLHLLTLKSDALDLTSQLQSSTLGAHQAVAQAKRSLKIRQRIWAILGGKTPAKPHGLGPEAPDVARSLETTTAVVSRTAPGEPTRTSTGPSLWRHAVRLVETQLQVAKLYADMGFWQEAIYFGEQAERVARSIDSKYMLAQTGFHLLRWWIQSERSAKAQDRAEDLSSLVTNIEDFQLAAAVRLEQGRMFHQEGEAELAMEHFDDALALLQKTPPPDRAGMAVDEMLSSQMQGLVLEKNSGFDKPDAGPKRRTGPRKKLTATRSQEAKGSCSTAGKISMLASVSAAAALRNDVICSKIDAHISMNDLDAASLLCGALQSLSPSQDGYLRAVLARHAVASARLNQRMDTDCTYNSLSESTLALPWAQHQTEPSSTGLASTRETKSIKANKRNEPGKQRRAKPVPDPPQAIMQEMVQRLLGAYGAAARFGSYSEVRHICRGLAETRILLSAIDQSDDQLDPTLVGGDLDFPSSQGLRLEYASIMADRVAMNTSELQVWPSDESVGDLEKWPMSKLQEDCTRLLPKSWSAVSVLLNDTKDELLIVRNDADKPALVLRLPMHRHRSREDEDEETFTFRHGRDELRDIVESSNASAHSNKDMSVKGAKSKWWAERKELDSRLRDLLANIENIWFGGFKSIFSQHTASAGHVDELRDSIDNILGKHLPSRQSRKGKSPVRFGSDIVNLFIGLGDPTELDGEQTFEFCNDVTDLLHFLIDNLQLQGESNAYDEIDFDEMAVDTVDVLKSWHQHVSSTESADTAHTILILDKSLHAFPWESMPCLKGRSVSRLPSLQALRERLDLIHAQASAAPAEKPSLDRGSRAARGTGTSILNPAGDLSRTESVLKPHIAQLPSSWTHYSGPQAPDELDEEKWSAALCESDIVLYFGHGSTAQYIRPRGVRKLSPLGTISDRSEATAPIGPVATTLLMGCSSVALTENGEFQPHGMILAYLAAGAPAVVGCLWDVTDRDCDRFSIACGSKWGLWADCDIESSDDLKHPLAQGRAKVQRAVDVARKARRRRAASADEEESVPLVSKREVSLCSESGKSLTHAVAESRSACFLEHLNGAAMVVYGIPVWLG